MRENKTGRQPCLQSTPVPPLLMRADQNEERPSQPCVCLLVPSSSLWLISSDKLSGSVLSDRHCGLSHGVKLGTGTDPKVGCPCLSGQHNLPPSEPYNLLSSGDGGAHAAPPFVVSPHTHTHTALVLHHRPSSGASHDTLLTLVPSFCFSLNFHRRSSLRPPIR